MSQFIRRTNTLTDVSFSDALNSENRMPLESAEGPCPFWEGTCIRICRGQGYNGGYCHGIANAICKTRAGDAFDVCGIPGESRLNECRHNI